MASGRLGEYRDYEEAPVSTDIEQVRARAEAPRAWRSDIPLYKADVLALLDEVERLRAVREEWRRLYSNAEAERDRLRAAVGAVRALADDPDEFYALDDPSGALHEAVYTARIHAALDEHLKEG